jgi:hypothetical protein
VESKEKRVPDPKIKIQKRRKEKSKMANPEHLAKLKESVEAWNKWRITIV